MLKGASNLLRFFALASKMVKHYSHLWSKSEVVVRVNCLSPKERTFTMNTNHIIGHAKENNSGLPLSNSNSAKTVSSSL